MNELELRHGSIINELESKHKSTKWKHSNSQIFQDHSFSRDIDVIYFLSSEGLVLADFWMQGLKSTVWRAMWQVETSH
jgi:hypothetical protein